jgi:hypothetical protein
MSVNITARKPRIHGRRCGARGRARIANAAEEGLNRGKIDRNDSVGDFAMRLTMDPFGGGRVGRISVGLYRANAAQPLPLANHHLRVSALSNPQATPCALLHCFSSIRIPFGPRLEIVREQPSSSIKSLLPTSFAGAVTSPEHSGIRDSTETWRM